MKTFASIFILFISVCALLNAQSKTVVTTVDGLPKHSYKLPNEKAQTIIADKELLMVLITSIKTDLLADLEKYEIQDHSSLRDYYSNLRIISFIQGEYVKTLDYIGKERNLADKESEKLIRAVEMEVLLSLIKEKSQVDIPGLQPEIKAEMVKKLSGIDFSLIQENVEDMKGRTEIYSTNFIDGIIESQIQPLLDNNKDAVPLDIAMNVVVFYYLKNYYLAAKDGFNSAYVYLLDTYGVKVAKIDVWQERMVNFTSKDKLTPVVAGIWDTGTDMAVLPESNRWVNTAEKADKIDNDKNGYIDDIHGIGFDMQGNSSAELLMPDAQNLSNIKDYQYYLKGIEDLNANIESAEATQVKQKLGSFTPDEMKIFLVNLGLYSGYAHGTHVAGITADGNPAVKILVGRLEFDYHNPPMVPDETSAQQWGEMFTKMVAYFKANKVRVVNMSWSVDLEIEFIKPMEANGFGNSDEERMALAKKLFEIEKLAYLAAINSAPEILFIAAAGNSNNDVDFAGSFPASLNLPNLLTIGAVDIEGKKTSFTTEGASVDVYANGYEVESFVPGGDRIKFSGTSMAAPQVANLAAKILAVNPKLNTDQLKGIIVSTSTKSDEGILLIHPAQAIAMAKKK